MIKNKTNSNQRNVNSKVDIERENKSAAILNVTISKTRINEKSEYYIKAYEATFNISANDLLNK